MLRCYMSELIWVEPNSERWLSLEDLPNEEWKDIENYFYCQVSNLGRVKSKERYTKQRNGGRGISKRKYRS